MGGLDEMFVANNPMFLRRLVRTPIPRSPPQIPHEKSTQTRIPTHPNTTHANLMFLRRVGPAALRRAGPPSNTETFLGGPALEANWSHPTDDFQQAAHLTAKEIGLSAPRAILRCPFHVLRGVALRADHACRTIPTAHAMGYHLPPSGLKNARTTCPYFNREMARLALLVCILPVTHPAWSPACRLIRRNPSPHRVGSW